MRTYTTAVVIRSIYWWPGGASSSRPLRYAIRQCDVWCSHTACAGASPRR
jgi:hypothetical protein